MLDFLNIQEQWNKNSVKIFPEYVIKKSKDLMIRGKHFYAIWDEENKIWSKDEFRAKDIIDTSLREYYNNFKETHATACSVQYASTVTGSRSWVEFTNKLMPDNYKNLNSVLIFKSDDVKKSDYVTKKLPYDPVDEESPNYDILMDTFFDPEERDKLEWALGAILTGASKKIQKFIVLYGDPGTGKSTFLTYVVQALFDGYYCMFDAKELGNKYSQFSLEPFNSDPIVAIQHDGDLSNISDNTKLNSIVSHEVMLVNEKHKNVYEKKFECFLFMGTNRPVDISSSKSGMNRRLIDVYPSGRKLSPTKYDKVTSKIKFELGAIAYKCINKFNSMGASYYNKYQPKEMKYETDDFFNFISEDYFDNIRDIDSTSISDAWRRYRVYCEDKNVRFVLQYKEFRTELKSYFKEYYDRYHEGDIFIRGYCKGFRKDKIGISVEEDVKSDEPDNLPDWLELRSTSSLLDGFLSDCQAQYAGERGTPTSIWSNVNTNLSELDTSKLHYVIPPSNLVVIDFDLKNDFGNKDRYLNLEAASKFPKTYAEFSKSGSGLHLHYIYDGDVNELSKEYAVGIEIKVFTGRASLRRMVSLCNTVPIAHISTGLPIKEEKKVFNFEGFKNEKALRNFIDDCIAKKHHGATKPEVDFIEKALSDMYSSGVSYDISNMRNKVLAFCMMSTNQSDNCMKAFSRMHFMSKNYEDGIAYADDGSKIPSDNYVKEDAPIVFYDIEVFPNLFLINWKFQGPEHKVVRMINPKPSEVSNLFKYRLIGYNNRRYDNHMIYAASMGYSVESLYKLSQRIVKGDKDAFFSEAYNLSYTDVYDFASTKQSLKKWEIQLGIHHQELGLPWDKPVPEDKWEMVAEYCDNDVIATEAVFDHLHGDWLARQILSDISGLSVNDTTNSHTIKIITNGDKNPEASYIYTNLATGERSDGTIDKHHFPGYTFNDMELDTKKKSRYRDEDVGEGGYVYAEPGMYGYTPVLDVSSMHPSTIEALELFGPYTKNFSMLKAARIYIKHKEYEKAGKLFDGKLAKYLTNDEDAAALSYALKIAINSVYGLTSAKFPNKLRDKRNVDNIVAKRGALFMIDLKHDVQDKGYKVVHIKTDSIKVHNADNYIKDFICNKGKEWGYTFEIEDEYDRICLVNDAVYIAKYKTPKKNKKTGEDIWWTATGAEFAHPYIFKTLFSHENIEFEDLCETKSTTTALYLDMNNDASDNKSGSNMVFIGKVGSFVPIKKGMGGGTLYREQTLKDGNVDYYSVSGTSGYEWLESETVKRNKWEDRIDFSYYDKLADNAKKHINEFGDFDAFVNGEPLVTMRVPIGDVEEMPF